jgi:hypothetical protein
MAVATVSWLLNECALPEAILMNATLDSSLLHYYGFEVLDVWEVVERVAMNTRNRVASPTNA